MKFRHTRTTSSAASTTRSPARPTCSCATPSTWRRCSSRTRARRSRCGTATTRRATTTSRRNSGRSSSPTMANSVRFGATRTQEQATRTDLDNGLLVFFPGRMSGIGQPRLRRDQRRRQPGAAVHAASDALHPRRRCRLGRRRTLHQVRRRVRASDDVRQPAAVWRRRRGRSRA